MSHGGSALFINSWGEGSAPFNKCEILKTQTNTLFPAWPWVLDILRRNSSIKWLYQSTQQSSGKKQPNQWSCSKILLQGKIWEGQKLLEMIFAATSGDLLSAAGDSGWVWLSAAADLVQQALTKCEQSTELSLFISEGHQRIYISGTATPKNLNN